MVIDFQHHYIPVQLAKKRGLYSETGVTMLEEGGLRATTMHQRLYDLDLQQAQLARAHGRYRKMEQARFVSMACEQRTKIRIRWLSGFCGLLLFRSWFC
jgi:hypothetical protein